MTEQMAGEKKSYKIGEKTPMFTSRQEKVDFERRQQAASASVIERNYRVQSDSWELAQHIRIGG